MPVYTYQFCDMLSGAKLAELPMTRVSFSLSINEPARFTGQLPIGEEAMDKNWSTATLPKRTLVYICRDGVPINAYILWKRRPINSGRAADMQCLSVDSYLAKNVILYRLHYPQADQLDIARGLVHYATGDGFSDIRIHMNNIKSGVLRDRTYEWWDWKVPLESLTQLAEVENGFEWTTTAGRDANGNLTHSIIFGYPHLGRWDSGIIVENSAVAESGGGSILSYEWPEDGADSLNDIWAVGAGEGSSTLFANGKNAAATDEIESGYPLLRGTVSYKDIIEPVTLQAHANEDLAASVGDMVVPSVTLRADAHPHFGTYQIGDRVRIRISSPYHAAVNGVPGIDRYARIVGMTITPPSESQGERVEWTLGRVQE